MFGHHHGHHHQSDDSHHHHHHHHHHGQHEEPTTTSSGWSPQENNNDSSHHHHHHRHHNPFYGHHQHHSDDSHHHHHHHHHHERERREAEARELAEKRQLEQERREKELLRQLEQQRRDAEAREYQLKIQREKQRQADIEAEKEKKRIDAEKLARELALTPEQREARRLAQEEARLAQLRAQEAARIAQAQAHAASLARQAELAEQKRQAQLEAEKRRLLAEAAKREAAEREKLALLEAQAKLREEQVEAHHRFALLCRSGSYDQIQSALAQLPMLQLSAEFINTIFTALLVENVVLIDIERTEALRLLLTNNLYKSRTYDIILAVHHHIKHRFSIFDVLVDQVDSQQLAFVWQMMMDGLGKSEYQFSKIIPDSLLHTSSMFKFFDFVDYIFNQQAHESEVLNKYQLLIATFHCSDLGKTMLGKLDSMIIKMAKQRMLAILLSKGSAYTPSQDVVQFLDKSRILPCFHTTSYSIFNKIRSNPSVADLAIKSQNQNLQTDISKVLVSLKSESSYILRANR